MSLRKFFVLTVCAVTAVLLSAASVSLGEEHLQLFPADDTYVNSAEPAVVYGTLPALQAGDILAGPAGTCRTFLKFELPALPPGATVTGAQLSLYCMESSPAREKRTVNVHLGTDNSWNEATATWSTPPGFASSYDPAVTDSVTSGFWPGWSHWDVTVDVQTFYGGGGGGGGGTYTAAVLVQGEPDITWNTFYSKEQPPEPNYSPRLSITYGGNIVPKGSDCYITKRSTYIQFGVPGGMPSIPAGFFGPGSDPFDGRVYLKGEPFDPAAGDPDTKIDRLAGVYLSTPDPCEIDIEIVELSLVSTEPVKVTYGGGITESFFDVSCILMTPATGKMIINMLENAGISGTYQYSNIVMSPILTFEGISTYVLNLTTDPCFGSPIQLSLSSEAQWQDIPLKEAECCGYDHFYLTDEMPLNAELTYNALPCGWIEWSPPEKIDPQFALISLEDWVNAMGNGLLQPVDQTGWQDYLNQFNSYIEDGDPCYPDTEFLPPEGGLYVYEDPNAEEPNDAGLFMAWGDPCATFGEPGYLHDGNDYAAAWKYVYPADPDLRNCTINITVFPPAGIKQVSLALVDAAGFIRGWYWNVGAAGSGNPLTENVNNKVTIDLSKTGKTAATPTATTYSNNPGFSLANVQTIDFDENGTFLAAVQPPPPGRPMAQPWNYWKNLLITKNVPAVPIQSKFYVKWSQRPDVNDSNQPKTLLGWDEFSNYRWRPIVADDWLCKDDRPVTDIHWWGSFLWWTQPGLPPQMPQAFHIGIWTDVSIADDPNFSHPGYLIWENFCDNYVWNFVGFDIFPGMDPNLPMESTFQFNQLLSEDEWFHQDPNGPWDNDGDPNTAVYWLSISAIYDPTQPAPLFPWGWKTRRPEWNDDAVQIWSVQWPLVDWPAGTIVSNWPPQLGSQWVAGAPIEFPAGTSWDMCFELTTNEPDPNQPAWPDLNYDGIVDMKDLALFVLQWLEQTPT